MARPAARSAGKKAWASGNSLGQQLANLAGQVEAALVDLLEVSSIRERFPNDGGPVVVITPHPWAWQPLADDAIPTLRRARDLVDRWRREGVAVLRAMAREFKDDFAERMPALDAIVDRSQRGHGLSAPTIDGVLDHAREALTRQRETLRLASVQLVGDPGETLLVPDTNGLYANPYLTEWEGNAKATVVIIPQVNRELDKHKNESADSVRKQKAELVIRQFDEFARRGDTLSGVPIAGALTYREEAVDVEPDPEDDLQIGNDDDRILANVLHLRRRHPEANVVLVTRDQNLKSKARRLRLTTDEPPTPQTEFKPRRPRRPSPDVVLGHPGGHISKTPLHELQPGEHSRLVSVKPTYLIENKGSTSIREVTTGVHTRDGRIHRFDRYAAQMLGPGESSLVETVDSIPLDFLDDVHESAAFDAFLFWARFTDRDGVRWEVVYDPASRETTWHELD